MTIIALESSRPAVLVRREFIDEPELLFELQFEHCGDRWKETRAHVSSDECMRCLREVQPQHSLQISDPDNV